MITRSTFESVMFVVEDLAYKLNFVEVNGSLNSPCLADICPVS